MKTKMKMNREQPVPPKRAQHGAAPSYHEIAILTGAPPKTWEPV